MEPDRYKQNHASYIIGLCCLILSLGLFAFSLYLIPYLFFNWQYNLPEFVTLFRISLQDNYALSASGAAWVIFLILVFPAVILFIVADVLSNKIDKQIYGIHSENETETSKSHTPDESSGESRSLVFKIVMIIVVVFIFAQFFHWVISST